MSDTPITDKAVADGNRKSALLANYNLIVERMRELEIAQTALRAELEQERRAREKAERNETAIRELMNCYNVGGWTDCITLLQRAEAAEAQLREAEQREAALRKDAERWRKFQSLNDGAYWDMRRFIHGEESKWHWIGRWEMNAAIDATLAAKEDERAE